MSKREIEIYFRQTDEVVDVIDVTGLDERQVLHDLRQQMDLETFGTRVVTYREKVSG